MVKIYPVLIFIFVVCALSVGFVFFYNPYAEVAAADINIEEMPVPLGAEVTVSTDIILYCQGQGTIEVSPYKTTYIQGENVKLTAHPSDGWLFDHWEGDFPEDGSAKGVIRIRMPGGPLSVTAMFVEE